MTESGKHLDTSGAASYGHRSPEQFVSLPDFMNFRHLFALNHFGGKQKVRTFCSHPLDGK